ncbi:hypothetical protein K461DRAFT_97485 [Myriangium duriaei CBS 260.36]|uniref:Uncharacterized protein n=1 Tax=Myriangium duriaei CBS 260.36 TaxID=1168546 RepID=A0A9P4J5K4_9PEZI|nr:hypothetical protein K461DRAFT_97485 [Myriangium duriaei CBS 260.36]
MGLPRRYQPESASDVLKQILSSELQSDDRRDPAVISAFAPGRMTAFYRLVDVDWAQNLIVSSQAPMSLGELSKPDGSFPTPDVRAQIRGMIAPSPAMICGLAWHRGQMRTTSLDEGLRACRDRTCQFHRSGIIVCASSFERQLQLANTADACTA